MNVLKERTYYSYDNSYYDYYNEEGHFLIDYKIGVGLDLGIPDTAALLTADIDINNSYGVYFNLGIGIRMEGERFAVFLSGIGQGMQNASMAARGISTSGSSGYYINIKSGDSRIGYTYFYNTEVYNNSYSTIQVNNQTILPNQAYSFYTSQLYIESNNNIRISYDSSGTTLYLYIK